MDKNTILGIAVLVVIGVVIFIYEQVKEKKNKALTETGEDMARLRDAVAKVLPGQTGYEVAYGHWEKVEYYGRSRRTTYYTYALAFTSEQMWMIPLGYEKNVILPGKPILITKESLGMATVTPRENKKTGELQGVSLVLRDKDGKSPVNLDVDVLNLRSDAYHHVNISQPEECEKFRRFISGLAETVSQENAGLDERMKADANKQNAKNAKTLGILGIVCFWLGPIDLIFGGMGLAIAPKPKDTDGKATAPFILNVIAIVLAVLVSVIGFVAIALS